MMCSTTRSGGLKPSRYENTPNHGAADSRSGRASASRTRAYTGSRSRRASTLPIVAVLLFACIAATGCAGDAYPHGSDAQRTPAATAAAPQVVLQTTTHWTDRVEMYAVYPPLAAGHSAEFAVHLTDARTFKPITAGRLTVEILVAGGRAVSATAGQPSAPGEYLLLVTVPPAGTYRWRMRIDGGPASGTLDLGELVSYPDTGRAIAAVQSASAAAISYPKAQQWRREFGVEAVAERDLRTAVRAPAVVRATSGGEAIVSAPAAGRFAGTVPPAGARVEEGQPLGQIEPRLDSLGDVPTLEAEVARRRLLAIEARNEMVRADLLVAARAVPARRFEVARHELDIARADLRAAEARLESRNETLSQGGSAAGRNAFVLRAPIGGTLAAVQATPGSGYEAGAPLFRIVRTDPVVVEAQVAERDLPLASTIQGAAIEMTTNGDLRPLAVRAVRHAGVIDGTSRSLPVWLEVANPQRTLLVGQNATVVLYMGSHTRGLSVPVSALLTEAGRPVVVIQTGGERFERRAVRVGARDGDRVAIPAGLSPGDRVVTRGAYDILLAAALPGAASGHVQ